MGKKKSKDKKPKIQAVPAAPAAPPVPYAVRHTKQFEKDLALMIARGKDGTKIREVMEKLINKQPLEIRHKDHPLKGEWKGWRDCHVEPDWVLIYKVDNAANQITFERTGTHSDLFE